MDSEVLVDQEVSQPHNVHPRNRGMPRLDFRAEPRRCLANYRELLRDREVQCLIREKLVLAAVGDLEIVKQTGVGDRHRGVGGARPA